MSTIYYIGLDIHKKVIAYCIKRVDGELVRQGIVAAERKALSKWLADLPGPWYGAMEATIFTGWVYDFLKPHALELKVAHPAMLKAITAAKKKNDRADAEKIADLLRVNLLPECHMMPEELREMRRVLRYRNMIVGSAVKMKNKMSGLLMEAVNTSLPERSSVGLSQRSGINTCRPSWLKQPNWRRTGMNNWHTFMKKSWHAVTGIVQLWW